MSGAGDCRQTQGSARRLYCSLSLLEMSVYTATWICGVLYSLYTLYLASLDQVNISKQTSHCQHVNTIHSTNCKC